MTNPPQIPQIPNVASFAPPSPQIPQIPVTPSAGGDPHASAQHIWRQHTRVAIGHLRRELKALRERAEAVSITTKSPAERLAEQAIAEAKLEQTVHLAELLLSKEDFDLLVDTLDLRKYVV